MKKITSLIMAVLMLCTMLAAFSVSASAESGLCGSDGKVEWELKFTTLRIYGHGNMINFDDWDETPWYEYDAYKKVKHIIVEDGITRVGSYAFAYFYYVEDIKLGKDVFTIEDYAFYEATCKSATDVDLVIPASTYQIGKEAFSKAMKLKNVNIMSDRDTYPSYVTKDWGITGLDIGKNAFYDCENMATLTVGNIEKFNEKTIRIGYAAFENCEGLHTLYFADSLASIGESGFCDCPSLQNIYYYGSEEDFNKVTIYNDEGWNGDLYAVIDGGRVYYKPWLNGTYTYVDEKGNTATLDGTKVPCRSLDISMTKLTGGWYIVDSYLDFGNKRIDVVGDANILLLDNCGINTTGGITGYESTISIFSESLDKNKMGYIVSQTPIDGERAGIGSECYNSECLVNNSWCNVNIHGGDIYAKGSESSAGIGSGYDSTCTVTITNGIIEAHGGEGGAGIGSGQNASCTVVINGGTIKGWGGDRGAGIGCGALSTGCKVEINGGIVEGTGGYEADGIGNAYQSQPCTVILNGGSVKGVVSYGGVNIGGNVTDNRNTGSVLSEGNGWIVAAVAVVAVAGVVTLVIVKKKKKKPALASGENTDE